MDKLPRRPLIGVFIFFVSGTLAGLYLPLSVPVVLSASASFLAFAVALPHIPPRHHSLTCLAQFFLLVSFALAACANAGVRRISETNALHIASEYVNRSFSVPVRVIGTVAGDLRRVTGKTRSWHEFEIRLEACHGELPFDLPAGVLLNVAVFDALDRLPRYGERWSFAGRMTVRKLPDGITAQPRMILRAYGHRRLSFSGVNPLKTVLSARRQAAQLLATGIEHYPRFVEVIQALTLGYRAGLHPDSLSLFRNTGTLHVFAISGLHVGIFTGLLILMLRGAGVPRHLWVFLLAPLLAGYTSATGAAPSAVRACIMALLYHGAFTAGRHPDGLTAVAAAALLILVVDPLQLHSVGFIYSFVVVTGLIVMHGPLSRRLEKLWQRDKLAPDPLFVEKTARALWRAVVSLIALSISAWLFSAPLTAYFFGRIVPVAVVSNLLIVPLAFLVVTAACLSIITGVFCLLPAEIFNHANLLLVAVMQRILSGFARLPGAVIQFSPPPVLMVVACYLLIAVLVLWLRNHEQKTLTADS